MTCVCCLFATMIAILAAVQSGSDAPDSSDDAVGQELPQLDRELVLRLMADPAPPAMRPEVEFTDAAHSEYPASAIGNLTITSWDGFNTTCEAGVVEAYLLVTAAHCLRGAAKIHFSQKASRLGNTELIRVRTFFYNKSLSMTRPESAALDIAYLILEKAVNGRTLAIDFNQEHNHTTSAYTIYGYQASDRSGQLKKWTGGRIDRYSQWFLGDSQNPFKRGSSGAPWLRYREGDDFAFVIGLQSYGTHGTETAKPLGVFSPHLPASIDYFRAAQLSGPARLPPGSS